MEEDDKDLSKINDIQANVLLDQFQIDQIFGDVSDTVDGSTKERGITAIMNTAAVMFERLPMLEVVFDSWVRLLSTSLRNFTSDNVEVALHEITSLRFSNYLNALPMPSMIAVFRAEEWDNYGLLVIDAALIYSVIDLLLGGRRGMAVMRIEGRPYTTIERVLIERLVRLILSDLSTAFHSLSPVKLTFERLETNPRFATIARSANGAISVNLRIDMEDRGGGLGLLLPYATLEPIREFLVQMFMGERLGHDLIWEQYLLQELWQTVIEVEAVLDTLELPLSDILCWEKGSVLDLGVSPDTEVCVMSGGVPLFYGKIGQSSGRIALIFTRYVATAHSFAA